ncbi:MAG: zinc-binding dehydrogenase [Pseudomonadota bacterium]
MRAAVCREFGQPFTLEEVSLAPPGPGEVRCRVKAVAICHSDITFAEGGWGGALPAVFGHEAAGIVLECGPGVGGLAAGDRVVITMVRHCGTCPCCTRGLQGVCEHDFPLDTHSPIQAADGSAIRQGLRTGAFAEEVVVEASQVVVIEDDLSFETASLLACGVITGYGAVANTAGLFQGADAVVIGTGGVGLNAVQSAHLAGAGRVIAIDLDPVKLAAARHFGATHCVNAREEDAHARVREITGGRGADFVFVTVGAIQAIDQSYTMLAPGGTSVLVGVPALGVRSVFDPVAAISAGQRILGSKLDAQIHRDIPALIEHWRAGRLYLDELVSRTFAFDEINAAMDATRRGEGLRNVVVMGEGA